MDTRRDENLRLEFPPLEMRQMVGPTDLAAFDNPTGSIVYPYLPPEAYDEVFDFGCGCGRVARQLIQQRPRPKRYLGIDLHRGMVRWCQEHLQRVVPNFEFLHHDVLNVAFNPGASKVWFAPFPAGNGEFTLVNALSVFTHLTEEQAQFYLRECARVLRPDGFLHSSWFLFDKIDYPMMQEFNNALYLSYVDPSAAVIFDRMWVRNMARSVGLTICQVIPPSIRGFQWMVVLTSRQAPGLEVDFPPDRAPVGLARPPLGPSEPAKVGLN
jgi:SAM-dependent methyltransferase